MADPRKVTDEIYDVLKSHGIENLPNDKNLFYNNIQSNKELRLEVFNLLQSPEIGITNLGEFEDFEMKLYEQPTEQEQILQKYRKQIEEEPGKKLITSFWNKVTDNFEDKEEQIPPAERLKVRTHEINKNLNAMLDAVISTPEGLAEHALNYNLAASLSRVWNLTQGKGFVPADIFLDAQETVLKWGKDAKEFTKEKIVDPAFPSDPKLEGSFAHTTVPAAFGSFQGMAVFGLLGKIGLTGKAANFLAPILTGIGIETASILEDAERYDKDVFHRKDLDLLYAGGMVSGTLEGLSMGWMFSRFAKIGAMPLIKKTISFLSNPAVESFQEYLQTITGNATAKLTYDTTRELTQGALEAAAAGGIVGFFFGSVGHIIQEKKKDPNLTTQEKTLLDKAEELYVKQGNKIVETAVNQKLSMVKFAEGIAKSGDVYTALKGIAKNDADANGLLNAIEQHPDFLETQGAIERLIGKDVEKLTKSEMKHLTHLTAIGKLGTVRQLLAEKNIVPEGTEANLPNSFDMYRNAIDNYTLKQLIQKREVTDESSKVPDENLKKATSTQTLREEEKTLSVLKEINDISIEGLYLQSAGPNFNLQGSNVIPFPNPNTFDVTSTFDRWLTGLGNKLDISKPFNIKEMSNFGKFVVEKFRQEYLAKNNFKSIPKERIEDFRKDWNNWLKKNFGLKSKEGKYENGFYGLGNILKKTHVTQAEPGIPYQAVGQPESYIKGKKITGGEVIISGDFLLKDMPHEYQIGNQEAAGLGWYIYTEIDGTPFIYEWQSDILPDLFGKSVSSTVKEDMHLDAEGLTQGEAYNVENKPSKEFIEQRRKDVEKGLYKKEIETLTSGEVRITDKDGTKYYNLDLNPYYRSFDFEGNRYWRNTNETAIKAPIDLVSKIDFLSTNSSSIKEITIEELKKTWIKARNIKEITKQEFEAKKEELTKQSAEEGLKDFIDPGLTREEGLVAYEDWLQTATPEEKKELESKSIDEILNERNKNDKLNLSTIPALENLYKRYWNIWLMHSFIYAKQKGHNTVWLPTGEAMAEIEGSNKTAAMYATKWDLNKKSVPLATSEAEYMPEENQYEPTYEPITFDKVGAYWTALNKIKGIKLELGQPEWSTVPLIKADISEVETDAITLFQKPTGKEVTPTDKVSGNQQQMASNKRFEAKQLADDLEKVGIADQTLKPLMDWLNETVGKIDVEIMDSMSPVGPNGELLGTNKGAYQQYTINGVPKNRIILNKDAFPATRVGVYQTLVHELFHAATINELKRNREFRDQITAIRTELNHRFKTDLKSAYKANQAEFDLAMESDFEFISHIMSGTTSRFKQLLKDTAVSNYSKQSILDKIIRIISSFMHKHMGMKPKSFHDALEIQLQRFINLRTDFEQTPSSDVVDYTNSQEVQDRIEDKLLTMREEALTDPATIEAIGKIVASSEGIDVSDYYKYLKLKSYDQILKVVGENPEWKSVAIFHYQKNFRGMFPSFELYKRAILKQFYNHIQNLGKQKVIRLVLTYRKKKWDDKVEPEINVVEFNDTYRDSERKPHSVYKPDTKLNELLPIMEKVLGVELELVYIDRVEKRTVTKGKRTKTKQSHIASQDFDHIQEDGSETRNEDYTRYLNKLGYYFPGTWADKKTVIAFKVKGEQADISKALKSFRDLYSEKSREFVKGMVIKEYGQKMWANTEREAPGMDIIRDILPVTKDPRLRDLAAYGNSIAQTGAEVMRLIAEDIRLGGRMTSEGWQTALYNPNDPNSYDAIKMFKRPYLVSEKSFVHLDKKEIDYKLNHVGFDHGMEWSDNELMTSAVIFDGEPKSGVTSVEYKDKVFDISQILIDTFGDATTDGKLIYVLGGFDEIYRSQHGVYHKGSIKAFIANRFNTDNFNSPFYVKGAFHGISRNEPLAQWMIKNNITFLVSSTAAKVNSYPVDNLYSAKPNVVKIPFKEIHRDHEKSVAKLSARGFAQTLTANYAIEFNPSFVDEGWTEAINGIVDNLHRKFKQDMHDLTPSGVLEYLKDKAFHGSSEYERIASKVILSMAYTKLDQQYANVSDVVDRLKENKLLNAKTRERAAQILDKWQTRYVNFSDQQAKKISNIFHDPYFTELLRGKIRDSMEYITRFKIPATWAVLDSDMGYLTARRYELIEKYVKEMFVGNRKKAFADKGAKIIDKLHQLTEEKANMFGAIESAVGEHKVKLSELDAGIQKDIDDYTKQYEEYYKDEKINYESNQFKESVRMNDENRAEINKMLNEIVDLNTGRMKAGYTLITSDIANRMKAKIGDKFLFDKKQNKIIVAAVPSDSILSTSGPTVVGIMSPELSEPGKIIMNSEYAQGILGKDFDIDTMYITFADKDMISEEALEKMANSLNKTIEKHKKKMLSEYRRELKNKEFTVKRNIEKTDGTKEWVNVKIPGNKLELQDILKKEVRLAYTQKFNGVKQGGRTLFNPAGEGRFLLNEYRKDVGRIVNRRKKFTTKSQIGLKTSISTPYGRVKINPRHKKAWKTYMLLLNMTNDMVDVPTNTNKFFYFYDDVKAFDQDNGTNLYDLKEAGNESVKAEIENLITAIDQVERFLFGYGIRLTTEHNLDKFGEERTMEDELKYIKQQQQINKLIDTKNFAELQRQFREWYELNNQYRDELEVEKEIEIGEQYIENLQVEDTNLNPMMRSINLFDETDIPAISMSEEEYIATQTDMVTSMLTNPKWKSIKEAFDKILENKHVKEIINKIPKSNYIINKQGFEKYSSNNLLAHLFYLTTKNPDLHLLKAGVITIINPENQTTYKKELLEPFRTNPTSGAYLDSIYQLANEISYPKLVRMLFKNRSIAFKKDVQQFDKGVRFRNLNGRLQVEVDFKGQTYRVDSTELPNRSEEFWKRTSNYIFGDMFKDPENRVKLTDMLELGGENTQITERIAVVSEMLTNELPKYSRFDRLLFWTSLLGKPENNMRKTTNFILPRTRKKGFYNQERLYQVLAQTNEEVANHFMYAYAPSFADNFRGMNFYENMKITQLTIDPQIFGEAKEIETWYQGDMHDAMDEVKNENTSHKADIESIYDIINQEERNITSTDYPLGIVFNAESQSPEFIYNIDVINTFSKYVTKVTGPVNKSMIALTKAMSVGRSINIIKNREYLRNSKIEILVNDMINEGRETSDKIWTDIHNIEESNPYNIIIEKNIGGSYSYYIPNRSEAYADTKEGLIKMFEDLGVPHKDMRKHQVALEYQKRYSIDHIEDADTMIDYFETLMRSLPKDFGRADVIEGILLKWRTLRKQFDKQMFKYFPRVYEKQIAYDVFRKENEALIETEVREKNPNLLEKEITDLIEREITDRFSNLSYDNYGSYIHSWMLGRKLADGDNRYVKNSNIPHDIHLRQFLSSIRNDILLSDWILYESEANADGTSQEIINKMHRWYGFISNHKLLRTKTIEISEAKENDGVHFYYRQKKKNGTYEDIFVRGIVDVISDDIVKVKVNLERMEKKINAELADKRKEHDEIVRQSDRPATATQLERLEQFFEENFIEAYSNNITKQEANDLIIKGYENMLGNRDNWGRFERKNVYIKQYEGADIKMVEGFYKEQQNNKIADNIAEVFMNVFSAAFLGGPSGGTRNFIDASWQIMWDLRVWRYHYYNLPKGTQEWFTKILSKAGIELPASGRSAPNWAGQIMGEAKRAELDKYKSYIQAVQDQWVRDYPELTKKELHQAAEGYAVDYIIANVLYEANLGDLVDFKSETFASKLDKLAKAGKLVGSAITIPFKQAEIFVRCQAAYIYARKAIVDDGITDPKLIRLAIEKGVARTQSLYDNMHRKLGEDSNVGKLLYLFSQYNSFQKQMLSMEIQQAKRLGIKFNFHNMVSRTIETEDINGVKRTHKAGDTIDPNIAQNMLLRWWGDTLGITLGSLIPGFRASNPVNKAVIMPLSFAAQMIVFGSDPDDWDLRDWAYGIAAFWFGLGFTLPIQIMANLSGKFGVPIPILTNTDKELSWTETLIPVNPRVSQFAVQVYNMMLGEETSPKRELNESLEKLRQTEKFLFGFNIITPTDRRYYSENQRDMMSRNIIEKPLYFLDKNRWLFTPIPILNIAGNQ